MVEPEMNELNYYLDSPAPDGNGTVCRIDIQGTGPKTELFPTGLDVAEVGLVYSLYEINPDRIRRLLDHIAEGAYALGLQHGRDEGDFMTTGSVSLSDQMPVPPGTLARLVQESGLLNRDQGGLVDGATPSNPGGMHINPGFAP